MTSGADARTGSRVVNLTTRAIGTVQGATQFGRVLVKYETGETYATERYNLKVIDQ